MSNGGVEAVEEFFPGLDEHFPIQHSAFNGKCTVEVSNIDGVNQDQLSQLQQNTCSSDSSDIVKPIGTAGRKPRAMRTKKNRLLTSVTLKKLKELVSIENTDQAIKTLPCPEHSKICKRIPKRVVRVSQKMRRSDKESSLSSYDAYLTDVVNEQEELRNEMLKDEMIAIKCGREPAYRQSRYELAIFQTATIKINPLFLMARCVDCHVDTHLEQRYFNFVLPYNPVEWLKYRDDSMSVRPTDKFNMLTNCIFQIQIQVPFDYISKIEPHPKHVVMKLKSCIDPSWIDLRNNSGGLLSGKLGEKLEMEKKINNMELKSHLEDIKAGLSNVDIFEFTFIKKNMVWFNHLIKVDFKFFKYLINEQGGDKAAIRRILKEKIEDNCPTRRVKKACNRARPEPNASAYFNLPVTLDYSKLAMNFRVTPLNKPLNGKNYIVKSLETGYTLAVTFPVLAAFIDQTSFENVPINIMLDENFNEFL